jgi:hypothetical protein
MKQVFTLSFLLVGFLSFSQQRQENTVQKTSANVAESKPGSALDSHRSASLTSRGQVRIQATPLPYDIEDKYMGRKSEFLNNLTVTELPSDFPVYDKQFSLKEYNAAVDAFYLNHQEILKNKTKEKLIPQKSNN